MQNPLHTVTKAAPATRAPTRLPNAMLTRERLRVEHMRRHCQRLIASLPEGRIFGVDLRAACEGANRVVLSPLEDDDKVRIRDGRLLIVPDCFDALARSNRSVEDASLIAGLYILHELAHLPQGIGAYRTVAALRCVDEAALLQLDLGADHVAALATRLTGPRAMAEIKDLQGHSMCAFPVGPEHTPGARQRKARRMISLRADFWLRARGVLDDDNGYVCATFGPAGHHLFLTEQGNGADRLVMAVEGSAADRQADRQAQIAGIDRVLDRVLNAAA